MQLSPRLQETIIALQMGGGGDDPNTREICGFRAGPGSSSPVRPTGTFSRFLLSGSTLARVLRLQCAAAIVARVTTRADGGDSVVLVTVPPYGIALSCPAGHTDVEFDYSAEAMAPRCTLSQGVLAASTQAVSVLTPNAGVDRFAEIPAFARCCRVTNVGLAATPVPGGYALLPGETVTLGLPTVGPWAWPAGAITFLTMAYEVVS